MFVLPPPPRYPTQHGYSGLPAGTPLPMIETHNILTNPSGPEYQFLVGEGKLRPTPTTPSMPRAHISPTPPRSPMSTPTPLHYPQPATAGTRLSLLNLDVSPLAPGLFRTLSRSDGVPGSIIQEHPNESQSSTDVRESSSDAGRLNNSSELPPFFASSHAPAFGEGNTLLAPAAQKDVNKRRKPKNSMSKSNSSFISRVVNHDALNKRLQERARNGLFAFANAEYLTKILFTKAHCLCHDVNKVTKSSTHIDVIMGFSTGEIIWWEPITQRYIRLNKNGVINSTPVSEIRWIPGSENLFLAAHMDGTLVVYDKEKEDASFVPEDEGRPRTSGETSGTGRVNYSSQLVVHKSVHSKNQKTNPVAVWKLSNHRLNAFAFSPDNRHLAVVAEDGTLRVIDYLKEELLTLHQSYYGGLTCVCWSPDGKYILAGGQDDLISIWSHQPGTSSSGGTGERRLVARCQGHHSWVTPAAAAAATAGFSPLQRTDTAGTATSGGSAAAAGTGGRGRSDSSLSGSVRPTSGGGGGGGVAGSGVGGEKEKVTPHPVEPRAAVAVLPAVLSKTVDKDPLCWIGFTPDAILTSCKNGHIRTWTRPTELASLEEKGGSDR
ncbi:hypothetical protein N0V88_005242 [Collariella sp. IMI 366227]|nr:hypothetical protein N0V88_005242 [Collariella sp. IMI 366227]